MYRNFKSFEDVKAWQLGRNYKNKIYEISHKFPHHELYCLTQQIRRSVVSITANIAEGYGRFSYQENINFCRIARGSVLESLDHLFTALDQKYLTRQEFEKLYREGKDIERAINGYLKFLSNQK